MTALIYGLPAHFSANETEVYDLASPATPGYRTYKNRHFSKLRLHIDAIGDTLKVLGKFRLEDNFAELHVTDGSSTDVNEIVEIICPRYLLVIRTEGAPGTDSKIILDE